MTDAVAGPSTDRRLALLGAKLRGLLVGVGVTVDVNDVVDFHDGAAVVADGRAWVLVDRGAQRSLGPALAWSRRQGSTTTSILIDDPAAAGALARRAGGLLAPPDIWVVRDRELDRAAPMPLPVEAASAEEHLAFVETIERAGAQPIVEHGVVTGEVRGLEVCRVVDAPTTGAFAEFADVATATAPETGAPGIEVGVGPNDREAFRIIHGHIPTVDALAGVVASVESVRGTDVPHHPLNRLARERFMRWWLEQDPEAIGLDALVPAAPPTPRPGLNDAVPCVASALDSRGAPVSVVCSSGVDLDLVGFVADVQIASGLPVIVALARRDDLPITRELLALLAAPVDIVTVDLG